MVRTLQIVVLGSLVAFGIVSAVFGRGQSEDANFTYERLDSLTIDAGFFDVRIEGNNGADVEIAAFDIPRGISVEERSRGNDVAIHVRGRNTWFAGDFGRPRLHVSVPMRTPVAVEAASGDVALAAIQASISIRTASGDVALRDAAGTVRIQTASGDIDVQSVTGGLELVAVSGDATVDDVRAPMVVETVSGDISVRDAQFVSDVSFQTVSGEIDIDALNDERDLRYDLASVSGDIEVGRNEYRTSVRQGEGRFSVAARSTSGDITIDFE